MPPTRSASSSSRRAYAAFLRRYRVVLVSLLLVGTAIGAVAFLRQPVVSTAVTRIAVTPLESSPGVDLDRPRLISLDSDAQVLTSAQVLSHAVATTGFPGGLDALSEESAVSAIPDSRVLVLRVSDVDPRRAVAAADAIATEFLRVRGDAATVRAEAASARLDEQEAEVARQLSELRAAADAAGGVLLTSQRLEAQQLTQTLSALQAERARTVTDAANPGRIVLPATILKPGGRPMGLATLASGTLLGGVAGLAGAVAVDQVRGQRQLRRLR